MPVTSMYKYECFRFFLRRRVNVKPFAFMISIGHIIDAFEFFFGLMAHVFPPLKMNVILRHLQPVIILTVECGLIVLLINEHGILKRSSFFCFFEAVKYKPVKLGL